MESNNSTVDQEMANRYRQYLQVLKGFVPVCACGPVGSKIHGEVCFNEKFVSIDEVVEVYDHHYGPYSPLRSVFGRLQKDRLSRFAPRT